jgi:pimeloyl-ACP methyl ester carboxylesterase
MNQKKNYVYQTNGLALMTILFVFIFSLSMLAVAENVDTVYAKKSVESIYSSIRHAPPQYDVIQFVVNFQNQGMNMAATLVLPQGVKKPAIVITCNGFAEDRFYKEIPNTGGEFFYDRVSRLFAQQGIATLRIDYRGSGESDGDYTMTTFSSQISDVLAAVEYVENNLKRKVDKHRIGLFGHSQGGLVISVASGQDKRVESVAMWSAPSSPPVNYSTLMTVQGIRDGLALPEGGTIVLPLYWKDIFLGDIELGKGFFVDLFAVDPVASIRNYTGPLMYVAGRYDYIVFPQPLAGQAFMNQHEGLEKLVVLEGDHEFNSDVSFEMFDDAVFWAAAWYLFTLD